MVHKEDVGGIVFIDEQGEHDLPSGQDPSTGGAGYLYGDRMVKHARLILHRLPSSLATCTAQTVEPAPSSLEEADGVSSIPPCPVS